MNTTTRGLPARASHAPETESVLNSRGELVTVPVYRCLRCSHRVETHPAQFAYTDWDGSHHAKTPCSQCDCNFYVPAN